MVKMRIREVAEKRGIKNAHILQLKAGLAPHVASRLWKGDVQKISLDTIGKLCSALGVTPGQLFEYDP